MWKISSLFVLVVVVGMLIEVLECQHSGKPKKSVRPGCHAECLRGRLTTFRCVYSHGQYRVLDTYHYTIEACEDPSVVVIDEGSCEHAGKFEDRYKCDTDCDRAEVEQPGPVCGTNNVTYANTCELFQDKSCRNDKELDIDYVGYCSGFNGYNNPDILGVIYAHWRGIEQLCSRSGVFY